jgi:hypothetical protein
MWQTPTGLKLDHSLERNMKTKTFEDSDRIVYTFSYGDLSREVVYYKCCFIFFEGQEADFDSISDKDLKNWIDHVSLGVDI